MTTTLKTLNEDAAQDKQIFDLMTKHNISREEALKMLMSSHPVTENEDEDYHVKTLLKYNDVNVHAIDKYGDGKRVFVHAGEGPETMIRARKVLSDAGYKKHSVVAYKKPSHGFLQQTSSIARQKWEK